MTDSTQAIAADQLKAIVERLEHLDEEIAGLRDDRKGILAEAKGNGFDAKAIVKLIALRKKDLAERQEEEAILELYCSALGV